MTNDEMKTQIFTALYVGDLAILRRYNAPEHLSANRQKSEINFMVEDIASELPGGIGPDDLAELIDNMHQHIRKNCRARSWPSVAQFVDAAKFAVRESTGGNENTMRGLGSSMDLDSDRIAADRINAGEPVSDLYLYGGACLRLLASGHVTQLQIDRYREGLYRADLKTVKEPAASKRRSEREAHHNSFLEVIE